MKIFINKNKLIKFIKSEKNLGFVPTMGSIHLGHISLFKRSISQCKRTIVSIFINKPQFNRKVDYQKYPRTLKKDILALKRLNVDYLYIPSDNQIYPSGPNKRIKISSFGKKLCGKFRSGHFEAVVDVIERFIKIINPKKIYLGEKDMQQLKIIEHFVKKNYNKIKVVGCKTIREKNGVAYSSRNFLLTSKEKKIASEIYKVLVSKKKYFIKKKISLDKIKNKIFELGVHRIDYIKLVDINKIIKPYKKNKKYRIFIAYYLRTTRLIDNI
ncbi:MAG: pantoate--beta-alanine ligase [Candidatus Pelagibacter sp.]|nr:pantoate--beta-alanine ligase [Candidatus Pelagibacter sp.]